MSSMTVGEMPAAALHPRHRRVRLANAETRGAAILVAPFVLLLVVAGIIPTIYAVVKSLQDANGEGIGLEQLPDDHR